MLLPKRDGRDFQEKSPKDAALSEREGATVERK